jgi:hypothetical protein
LADQTPQPRRDNKRDFYPIPGGLRFGAIDLWSTGIMGPEAAVIVAIPNFKQRCN